MKIIIFLTYNLSLLDWEKSKVFKREIYPFLKRENIHFKFVSYGELDESKLCEKFKNLSVYNLKRFKLKNQFMRRVIHPFFALIYDRKLKELVNNSDYLISNQMDGSLLPAIFSFFYNKKFILRTGYSLSYFKSRSSKFKFLKRIFIDVYEFICILFSYKYTISSNYEYELLKKRFPFFLKKTFVIPNWINTEIFRPFKNKNDSFSLISIGRLVSQKNPLDLILISKLSNMPLTIIGDGYLKNFLLDFINEIKAPVKIIPRVVNSELPNLLNQNSIYLSTSLYEGSPKTILEAMSCGLLTIAYSAPGIEEIIFDNVNGFLTKPSPYFVNDILQKLKKNKSQISRIGISARNHILEKNSFEKILKLQNNIYFS